MSSPASPTKVTRSFFFRSHRFLVSYRRQRDETNTHTHFVSVCIAETLAAETFVPLCWVRVAAPEASDVGLSGVTRLGNIVSSCSACALWNWCEIALMVPCLRCLRNLGYQAHYYGLFGSCRAPGKVVHC